MRPLSAAELLDVWEHGRGQVPFQRALALLAAACPDEPPEALAELSIGQRDDRLLTLRAWAFGAEIASVARCPRCGAQIDLSFRVDDIRAPAPQERTFMLPVAGYDVQVHLPNSHDMAALMAAGGTERELLRRCVLGVAHGEQPCDADALPPEVAQAVIDGMARADPQADVQLALVCPECGSAWQAPFDIVSFFWSEIDAWAYRMIRDIHMLASAYGWREGDILALSPLRRRMYLEMLGA